MTSQEFGALIRARREAKGLTVEELAGRFKLSARTLHAIENGVLEGLPHAVYAKGFVRSYAQSAGVSPDDVESGIEALFPRSMFDDVAPMPGPIDRQRVSQKLQRGGGDKLVALSIILVLLVLPVLAGWFVISRYGNDIMDLIKRPLSASSGTSMPGTSAPEPPVQPQATAPRPAEPSASTVAASPAVPVAPVVPPVQVNATIPVVPPAPAAATSRNTTVVAPVVTAAEAAVAEAVEGNRVSVEARAECYVQAMADGESPRTSHVYPGQTSVYPFKKKLVLILGNAGGVTLRYNGKIFPHSGKDKERISLTFPPR